MTSVFVRLSAYCCFFPPCCTLEKRPHRLCEGSDPVAFLYNTCIKIVPTECSLYDSMAVSCGRTRAYDSRRDRRGRTKGDNPGRSSLHMERSIVKVATKSSLSFSHLPETTPKDDNETHDRSMIQDCPAANRCAEQTSQAALPEKA